MKEKIKTVATTILVCTIVALALYIRFEQGAYKGMETFKNDQITQLQEQLKVAQDLK